MTDDVPGTRHDDALRRVRTASARGAHGDREGIWPVTPPIVTGTAYASHDADAMQARIRAGEPTYNRDHFPNVEQLEALVAALEGAEAGYATASGMAAISLVALTLLDAGGHIVLGAGGYSDTEELFARELPRFGIACTVVDLADLDAVRAAIRPETGMLFAETIANPAITVADIPALAALARPRGIPLVVDNTLPTPALCRPLEHGADLVVHSVTKYLGGHHDLSAGVVVGDSERLGRIRALGYLLGAVPGAHDAALAVRGIRTLVPRMTMIDATARRLVAWLRERPEVAAVRYPDCEADGVAARLLPDGAGGVFVVELAGASAAGMAASLVRKLRMIPYAASLGGEITTVCYPPRLLTAAERAARTGDTELRFSVGLEHPDDLIADLEHAFSALP